MKVDLYDDDPVALASIANMFSLEHVQISTRERGFIGWVVTGLRPLSLIHDEAGPILAYGGTAHVFKSYGAAVDTCKRTYLYAEEHGMQWFTTTACWGPMAKLRIFSVGHNEEESDE